MESARWIATALGACRYAPAQDTLWRAAYTDHGAAVVTAAIGSALVAIEASEGRDTIPALTEFLDKDNLLLIVGGTEAVALQGLSIGLDMQRRLLSVASRERDDEIGELWRGYLLLRLVVALALTDLPQ